jgi:hypothetical protein
MFQAELYRFLPHILGILSENPVENRETIRNVFRNIIPIPDVHASTNLPKTKPEELSAADLLVLLHEQEKSIGVSAAKEGENESCSTACDFANIYAIFSYRYLLYADGQVPIRGFGGCHAAYHRFGFPSYFVHANGKIRFGLFTANTSDSRTVRTGDSIRSDIQIACRLCINDTTFATDHQENLDHTPTLVRIYALRQSHSSGELWSSDAAT